MENTPNVVEEATAPAPEVKKPKRQLSEKQKENLAKGREAMKASKGQKKAKSNDSVPVPAAPVSTPVPAAAPVSNPSGFSWSEDIEDRIVRKMMTEIKNSVDKAKVKKIAEYKAAKAAKAAAEPKAVEAPKAEPPKEIPQAPPITQSAPAPKALPKTGNKRLDRLMSV